MIGNTEFPEVASFEADLVAIRQRIHRNPELGFEELQTADLVSDLLAQWGVSVRRGIAKTGVIGTIRGLRPGARSIALRADMDALNIEESTGAVHASVVCGKMHACGHDGHTAMLLGAARFLAARRAAFGGEVHLIFQPAEEGLGGARKMLEEGIFDLIRCDAIFGMHNWPGLAEGKFGIRTGAFMAASDTWGVRFRGPGGHGAVDVEKTQDPTIAAAQFITGAQSIISRNVAAADSAVLSVGHLSAGSYDAPNVIPATVTIRGTSRSFLPSTRDLLERRIRQLAGGLADAHGCGVEVEYQKRYPPLINHAYEAKAAISAAQSLVGSEAVETEMSHIFGAEDFAFMLERKPGAYILIGAGINAPRLHSPTYDFNDEILSLGTRFWVALVLQQLASATGANKSSKMETQ